MSQSTYEERISRHVAWLFEKLDGPNPDSERPICKCCGYEAPLPTLRQFNGLCLPCQIRKDEQEDAAGWSWPEQETGDDYWPSMDDCRRLAN